MPETEPLSIQQAHINVEPQTVFIVTAGQYSDYHIEAVFSTRQAAEEYASVRRDDAMQDTCQIAEWRVDAPPDIRSEREWWCSIWLENGDVTDEKEQRAFPDETGSGLRGEVDWFEYASSWHLGASRYLRVRSYVSAEHARKLAVEARQAWLRRKTETEHD